MLGAAAGTETSVAALLARQARTDLADDRGATAVLYAVRDRHAKVSGREHKLSCFNSAGSNSEDSLLLLT